MNCWLAFKRFRNSLFLDLCWLSYTLIDLSEKASFFLFPFVIIVESLTSDFVDIIAARVGAVVVVDSWTNFLQSCISGDVHVLCSSKFTSALMPRTYCWLHLQIIFKSEQCKNSWYTLVLSNENLIDENMQKLKILIARICCNLYLENESSPSIKLFLDQVWVSWTNSSTLRLLSPRIDNQ